MPEMSEDRRPERGMHGMEAVAEFLTRQHAAYEMLEHTDTFAAVDEADVVGSARARMAKTVLLHDHAGLCTAVIPASERVDLDKVRRLLGTSGHLRLATEEEMEEAFPAFDPGALPPFSGLLGTPEIVDPRLFAYDRVLCSGGDHAHTLRLSPRELERLGTPLVGDVCRTH